MHSSLANSAEKIVDFAGMPGVPGRVLLYLHTLRPGHSSPHSATLDLLASAGHPLFATTAVLSGALHESELTDLRSNSYRVGAEQFLSHVQRVVVLVRDHPYLSRLPLARQN